MPALELSDIVDWDAVDDELARVPTQFKDPRFDSLRHVLNILGPVDANLRLEELREQHERVEQLVDDVVSGYYNGFNKAIANYSQILHLFTSAQEQGKGLRTSLDEAKRRLGAQSQNLHAQRDQGMTCKEVVRILSDISSLAGVSHRILQLEQQQDWAGAVAALLDGCSKLAREEMAQVKALQDVKADLAARKEGLQKKLVLELERLLYAATPPGDPLKGQPQGSSSQLSKLGKGRSGALPPSGRTQRLTDRGGQQAERPSSVAAHLGNTPLDSATSLAPPADALTAVERAEAASRVAACLVQVCGHFEALATIRRHMPMQIKSIIIKALQSYEPPKEAVAAASPAAVLAAAASGGPAPGVPPPVGHCISRMTNHVFLHCLQVLTNLMEALKLLAGARPPIPSPGLNLLLSLTPPRPVGAVGDPTVGGSPQMVKRECEAAWLCIQSECQALLADIAAAPSLQAAARSDAGRRAELSSTSRGGVEQGALTFSFDVQVAGMDISRILQRQRSVVSVDEAAPGSALKAAMCGWPASADFTPFLCRPVSSLVEAALRLLADLGSEQGLLGKSKALLGTVVGLDDTMARSGTAQLRNALERFISGRYLPDIYVVYRSRCARLLEEPEGFKAPARPKGGFSAAAAAAARPLVPVAVGVKAMVSSLLSSAALMPLFDSHLLGVVENILGRVLDAFATRVASTIGGAACRSFVEDPGMATLMAREAFAPQAGEPVAFFVGRNAEAVDSFITAVLRAGFGGGGSDSTTLVLAKLWQAKSVASEQLLNGDGSGSRWVALASLADSLSFLAEDLASHIARARPHEGEPQNPPGSLGSPTRLLQTQRSFLMKGDADGLLRGLSHLMDQYRALAGQAVRALRLDLHLMLLHHMALLPRGQWVLEVDNPQDVDECIARISRTFGRADEDIGRCLAASQRGYVFGSLAVAAATFAVWLLPDIKDMTRAGAAKMKRHVTLLRDAVARTGGVQPDEAAAQAHERAREYFEFLSLPTATLLSTLEQPRLFRYTSAELAALLQVHVRERQVTSEDRVRFNRLVGQAPRTFQQQAAAVLETSLNLAGMQLPDRHAHAPDEGRRRDRG